MYRTLIESQQVKQKQFSHLGPKNQTGVFHQVIFQDKETNVLKLIKK